MSEQLHAPNAVLPGKWAISLCKQGWVAPGLVQTGMRKGKSPVPHQGTNPTVQPVTTPSPLSLLPATQSVVVCLWHTVGGKIMKIIRYKDLYDTNSTFVFSYLMIHVFISFQNYTKHLKKCVQLNHICIVDISHKFHKIYFIKNFSMNTTHFGNCCFHFQEY